MKKSLSLFSFFFCAVLIVYFMSLFSVFLIDDLGFVHRDMLQKFRAPMDFLTRTDSQHFNPVYYAWNTFQFRFSAHPVVMHLITLLLLTGACLSVYYLILALGLSALTAFYTALLFGIHPIQFIPVVNLSANFLYIYTTVPLFE